MTVTPRSHPARWVVLAEDEDVRRPEGRDWPWGRQGQDTQPVLPLRAAPFADCQGLQSPTPNPRMECPDPVYPFRLGHVGTGVGRQMANFLPSEPQGCGQLRRRIPCFQNIMKLPGGVIMVWVLNVRVLKAWSPSAVLRRGAGPLGGGA